MLKYAAGKLFIRLGTRANRQIRFEGEDLKTTGEICRLLDGVPLAIELAAGCLSSSSLQEVLTYLKGSGVEQLALTVDAVAEAEEGGGLSAAVETAINCVPQAAQDLLESLSVFEGGFTEPAALQVAGGNQANRLEFVKMLKTLVNGSLVVSDNRSLPRYRIMEYIRGVALGRLRVHGREEVVRRSHATWVYESMRETDQLAWTDGGVKRLRALKDEVHNLNGALRWCGGAENGKARDPEMLVKIAGAAAEFWMVVGHRPEGARWYDKAIEVVDAVRDEGDKAKLYLQAARVSRQRNAPKETAWLEQAIDAFKSGHPRELYLAKTTLARKLVYCKGVDRAAVLLREARTLWDGQQAQSGQGWPAMLETVWLQAQAYVCERRGEAEEAERLLRRVIDLAMAHDEVAHGRALGDLAESLFVRGAVADAIDMRREAAKRLSEHGLDAMWWTLMNLAAALTHQALEKNRGPWEALEVLGKALRINSDSEAVKEVVEHIALMAYLIPDVKVAGKLLGFSKRAREHQVFDRHTHGVDGETYKFDREQSEQRAYELAMRVLRDDQGDEAVDGWLRDGEKLDSTEVAKIVWELTLRKPPG